MDFVFRQFKVGQLPTLATLWNCTAPLRTLPSLSSEPHYQGKLCRSLERVLDSSVSQVPSVYEDGGLTFARIWDALIYRSTSKTEDLCLILANLLDLDSYKTAKMGSPAERMKAILCRSGGIPVPSLFNHGSQYRNRAAYRDRWLPLSVQGSFIGNSCKDHVLKIGSDNLHLIENPKKD